LACGARAGTIGDVDATFVSAVPSQSSALSPARGGTVVVCSDGVWDHLRLDEVSAVVLEGRYMSAASAARRIMVRSCDTRSIRGLLHYAFWTIC
jgi:hypothetical protein